MKKTNKKLVSILMICMMLIQMFSTSVMAYSVGMEEIYIPEEATIYAENHYKEALAVVKKYSEYYNVTDEQLENLRLGKPFVIYELEEEVQDEIYYYPLLDENDNVILLLSVMGTTEDWNICVSEEWVNELNEINITSSEYIFYKSDEGLCAESITEEICLAGEKDAEIKEFSDQSYKTKKKIINEAIDEFEKTDVHNNTNNILLKDMYTPSFSSSTTSSKICALYNAQGQGSYGICWAASVATICNYLTGNNITAIEVADEMNIDYEEGAVPYFAQEAMSRYGVRYQNLNEYSTERMSWESLKININYKYPVYVSAKAGKSGHAVVAYGYMIAAGVKYVAIWNPGIATSITAAFKESGTTFTYNNKTFTWTYSISRY